MPHTTLVSVAELQDHLFNAKWCVVDCRHDLTDFGAGWRAYQAGHVPNAVFAHIEDDLSGAKTGANGRHPLPRPEDLAALFDEWGIANDTQIVAYDAQAGQFAGRLWWLARWIGHEAVAVLDGGWPAWLAATQWSSTEEPDRTRGFYRLGAPPLEEPLRAHEVEALLAAPGGRSLLDARAPERYSGAQEPIDPVGGHIPGALNRFWQSNVRDGRFRPREELRADFDALLAGRPADALVHYCGSGVTAAHNVLAMHVAGLPGARLYAGSWSEWIADPAHPVATGPAP